MKDFINAKVILLRDLNNLSGGVIGVSELARKLCKVCSLLHWRLWKFDKKFLGHRFVWPLIWPIIPLVAINT